MEDYIFTDRFPSNTAVDLEVSLFNTQPYRMLQSASGWSSFYIVNQKHMRIEGAVHFYKDGPVAKSPYKAPFGSFEFAEGLPMEQRYQFIKFTEDKLRALGIETIILKNPLRDYSSAELALLEVFLLNRGWRIEDAEVGCIIDARLPIENLFGSWEARKFRQATEAGLVFKSRPHSELDTIYFFILACRKKKNYTLSMSLKDLRQVFDSFPEQYGLYGLYHEGKLVAASITVQVTRHILYHFYTDHDDSFDKLSPIVYLTVQLVKEAAKRNIYHIDLGTSAYGGEPNFGLLNFKLHLGGKPSSKLTFVKSLK